MRCGLWPNLKTGSYHAMNRTATLKLIESNEKYILFYSFKNSLVAENYLSFMTTKRFRDTLTRFRLRACGLRSHKVWFLTEAS